jgi:hypothetical protein
MDRITILGLFAVTAMLVCYALEARSRWFVLAGSIVVIGGRERWWPTRENKLARQLRREGHEVVFKETE